MSTSQTPDYGEPWKLNDYNTTIGETGDYEGGEEILTRDNVLAAISWNPDDEDQERFQRIIQCVNDCAGMTDPAAEIAAMRSELNILRWIPITERLPTIEDGDHYEDVEWSDGLGIWEGNYTKCYLSCAEHRKNATHWRRITLP